MDNELISTKSVCTTPNGRPKKYIELGLFRTPNRVNGKRYFIRVLGNGCSDTWITDLDAYDFKKKAEK